jgi:hypothetical protein
MEGDTGEESGEESAGDFGDESDQEAGESPENEGGDFGDGGEAQPKGDFGKSLGRNKTIRIVV